MYGDSLATRHGMGGGIIYVVTKKSLKKPLEVFFFLTNLKLGSGINLNPVLVYDPTRKDIAVTPEEYVEFLGTIFPTWWKHQDRYPDIEPFRSLVKNIRDKQCSLGCVDSGNCAYSHVYVGPNGKASHCGRSADWNLLSYGTIQEHSFVEIFSNKQRELLLQRNEILQNGECQGCRFWSICHGGCPLDAYSEHQDFMYKTEWCEAKRRFIECYFEPITGLRYEPPK
jgi:radical SAM protein with 4Fe4S-binding SPASM domain